MSIDKNLGLLTSLVFLTSGFLYMMRSCLVFLTIYVLQIPGSIVTPITGAHLFPKPVIGVYIFGINGVNVELPVYPGNNSSTNEV